MKAFFERLLIRALKLMNTDLLAHAHVQIGAGHNTFLSGEEHIVNVVLDQILKRQPKIIFDVGANIGDYVKMLRSKFPETEIYCFEPGKEAFEKLVANTTPLWTYYQNIAVGSKNGTIRLFKSSNDDDGAMMTAYQDTISDIFTFAGDISESAVYEMTTLDNFCDINKISSIDFLKIDVEGHELEVLRGATKMIMTNKINIIQFEFNEFNIVSRSFIHDFYKILPQYHFFRIMPKNKLYAMGEYTSANEIFRYQNILAVNTSLNYNYAV